MVRRQVAKVDEAVDCGAARDPMHPQTGPAEAAEFGA